MNYQWNWNVFLRQTPTGNETYLDWMLAGIEVTVSLSLASWLAALALGILVGTIRTLPQGIWPRLATAYVEVFRNIPLLVQLFIWYFVIPELLPLSWGKAFKEISPMWQMIAAAWLCLSLFTSARVAEQVRAGIESLPKGQRMAGRALGLSLVQTYRYVLLPTALRVIVPPLTSEFLNIFKNSSVCSTIGLLELAAQGRQLIDYTAQPYESFAAVTLAYMAINLTVMMLMKKIEIVLRIPGATGVR